MRSWGCYPPFAQTSHPCHGRSDLPDLLAKLGENYSGTLPYGNGRSYGDSCLAVSGHALHTRWLKCVLAVDWEKGEIVAESGILLEELLALAIPRGWFLPVTPGTKFVTLGGAVANDVHGKNHHKRGTLGRFVKRLSLVRSDQKAKICSEGENRELFAATIGGLGLTGVIEWVELKLLPIRSSNLDVVSVRFDSLREFFTLSEELDEKYEYTVAWIDGLASIGRGVFIAGNHAERGSLRLSQKRKLRVPLPRISAWMVRLFNACYFHSHQRGREQSVVDYDSFFYPLDRFLDWNRLYGSKGFQQYHCVIPHRFAEAAIDAMLELMATAKIGSFLAVLKRCGDFPSPGVLSFPMPGFSLALDFPQQSNLPDLFSQLDGMVRQAGGRLYPAKDAHMSADDFQYFFPTWRQVEALRDPVLCSHFWKRVALV